MESTYNILKLTFFYLFSWQVNISYNYHYIIISLFIVIIFCFLLLFDKIKIKIKYLINHFGENDLRIKSLKESKQLTFRRLIVYHFVKPILLLGIKQIYYPTYFSFIVSLTIIFLLSFLPWPYLSENKWLEYIESNFYQNYIAIHTGIGAIILALLILVAETSNSGKQSDKARLILKETLVFPLVEMEILSLLSFAIGMRKTGALLSLFIVGLLTIFSIYRVTRLLINRYIFQQKEQQLIKDRFSNSLSKKISDRIATNTFLSYLKESSYEISYRYFYRKNEATYAFALSKRGLLFNIKLDKLQKLLSYLEQIANLKNNTIKKSFDKKRVEASLIKNTMTNQSVSTFNKLNVSLLKLIGEKVTNENNNILEIPKSLIGNNNFQKRLQKLIDSIFLLSSEDLVDKEIRLELDETKEKAFVAIDESRIGTLSSIMEVYEILIYQFLDVFQTFGGGYNSTSAKKERLSLFGGWSYIQWIKEDMMNIFNEAVKSKKEKLVKEITYTPIKILNKAFEKKDHLIFQEFLTFQPYLYVLTQETENHEIKNFLFDRSSRYLKEFCEYKISSELEDYQIETEEITHVKDFVLEIIQIYNNLLKYALNKRDTTNFCLYLSDLYSILHRFKPLEDNLRLIEEIKLKNKSLDEKEKREIENNLNRISLLEQSEIEIKQNKDEMILGLTAWCLGKLKNLYFNDKDLLHILNKLFEHFLLSGLNELIELFGRTTGNYIIEEKWGWTLWDLEEQQTNQDGIIMTRSNFDSKIIDLFAILLLKKLKGKSIDKIKLNDIKIKRNFLFYIDKEDSFVNSSIIKIVSNQSQWQKILNVEETKSKLVALSLLSTLAEKQKKDEKKILINTNIDPQRINNFIENFVSEYNDETSLRKILDHFDNIELTKTISKTKNYWGFNEIQDKEPFLKSWHIDYGNFGEHYGRGLAETEDQIIFNKIKSESKYSGTNALLPEAIISGIKELENKNFKPTVIFTTFYFDEWRGSAPDNQFFIPSWKVTSSPFYNWTNFIGLYKYGRRKIPIFRYWIKTLKEKPEIIVSDLKKFVKLNQYQPYSNKSELNKSIQKNYLLFKITDLSADSEEKTRNKLIKKNPLWLRKKENKIEYLKQKVVVHIKEKFEVTIKDKSASVKIVINFPEV